MRPSSFLRGCWGLGVLGLVCATLTAQRQESLPSLVAAAERLGARVGLAVLDEVGTLLYAHRAAEAFAPASNQKLLTACALLSELGAQAEFATRFQLRDGVLVVTSGGDPNLRSGSPYAAQTAFDAVAAELRRAGVTTLGDIVLDAGSFRGPARPEQWPADQFHLDYCAPTSPWLLDAGMYTVQVAPGQGLPTAVVLAPWQGAQVVNKLRAATKTQRPVYGATNLGEVVTVRGWYGKLNAPREFQAVMHDPRDWFLALLRWRLQAGGIVVGGATTPGPERELLVWRTPLQPALRRMLEDSSNLDAEQCARVLGARHMGDGSLVGGARAVQDAVAKLLGGATTGLVVADASGLSPGNRVTPRQLAQLLQATQVGAPNHVLGQCLPVAGKTGTLEDRFVGTDLVGAVHAKTGWIRGVSALSGFLTCDKAPRYFAILMNYDRDTGGLNRDLKRLQERMVAAMRELTP